MIVLRFLVLVVVGSMAAYLVRRYMVGGEGRGEREDERRVDDVSSTAMVTDWEYSTGRIGLDWAGGWWWWWWGVGRGGGGADVVDRLLLIFSHYTTGPMDQHNSVIGSDWCFVSNPCGCTFVFVGSG